MSKEEKLPFPEGREPEILSDETDENGNRVIKFRVKKVGTCIMRIPKVSDDEIQEGFSRFLDAAWKLCNPGEPVPDRIRLVID